MQLATRFGPLDASTVARLRAASAADLDRWAVRVLNAATIAEVLTTEK